MLSKNITCFHQNLKLKKILPQLDLMYSKMSKQNRKSN